MDIYKKNLEALSKTHPHLVQIVENTSLDNDSIMVSKALSGHLKVTWKRLDRPAVVITDSDDLTSIPEKAKNLLAQQKDTRIILLLGFGLGGYPKVLHENLKGDGMLIVYEAVPELFKIALQGQDLTPLLSSECFKLILGEETEDFSFVIKYHRKIVQKNFYILKQHGCVALNETAYERFRTKVSDVKRLIDTRIQTGIGRGAEWADAFIRNIPVILRSPGVIKLRNLFKGRPAIIVSAGPSIEKNFHLLGAVKGKAIIIAVDVVVPTLVPAGIIPDFIIALEANRKLFRAFEGNPLLKFCPLICSAETDYATMTSVYPGPVFLNPSNPHPVLKWLQGCWEDKGYVPQPGGSVSHTAFAIAEYIGANVIALMGQDLSFKEKLHAGDVTELFYGEGDVEEHKRRNPKVQDIFGEERYTMKQFLGFRTSFEEAIKAFQGIVINATEGGLPIRGAKTLRLKDFIDEYCNQTPINTFEIVASLGDAPTIYDLPALMARIQHGIKEFTKIRKNTKEIIRCVLRLKELKKANKLKSDEAVQLIRQIAKREKVVEDPILKVIAPYRYRMENYMRHDEIDVDTFDAIQDSLDYYGDLTEAIEIFLARLDGLNETLKGESQIDNVTADENLNVIDRYYRAGLLHGEVGMVREATKAFEKALTEFAGLMDPELQKEYWPVALKAHALLAELYLKQHRFNEAKEILEVLNVLVSNDGVEMNDEGSGRDTISKQLNICHEKAKIWDERRAKAALLMNKSMANYGSHLESGWFYAKVGDHDRAEKAYLAAIEGGRSITADVYAEPMMIAPRIISLLGAYYGLAQTYFVMERNSDAIIALDSGRQEIGRLLSFDFPEAIEEFTSLFMDLYVALGERGRAEDICRHVLTIMPNSALLKEKMQVLGHKEMDQLKEARL